MLRETFSELVFRTSSGFLSAQGTVASLSPVAGADGNRLTPDAILNLSRPPLSRKRLVLR
jgi:hypothetical protein